MTFYEWLAAAIVAGLVIAVVVTIVLLKKRNMDIWLRSYVTRKLSKRRVHSGPTHVVFSFVDHFEPQWKKASLDVERERVDRWYAEYPAQAAKYVDADGRHPQHTFFYPEEEYRAEHLDKIAEICARGYGEIEVHLHHENDTAENLRKTLDDFVARLHERHGAFTRHPVTGKL